VRHCGVASHKIKALAGLSGIPGLKAGSGSPEKRPAVFRAARDPIHRPIMNPIVLIPARMASSRLPGKPLAEIGGVPMIVRVWAQAMRAGVGPVVVAAAEDEIADAVEKAGGHAVLTHPDLPSGSDRIFAALQLVDPAGRHDVVINCQGDLPALDPGQLRAAAAALAGHDIATLAAPITDEADRADPAVVKAVVAWEPDGRKGKALYFSRATVPAGPGDHFYHVGLYAYRRAALQRFVQLPPSPLEVREKLEQLRALEAGMRIAVARVDAVPLSVDTPEDLEHARKMLS
jgi:3-deoxy-manno-octulosonate cytidylyltransferase (CMP-KDO synthetase)